MIDSGVRAPRRRVSLRSPAKVNLHLEVLHTRTDGYHEIETVLQAVTLFDHLLFELEEQWSHQPTQIDLLVEPHGTAPDDETNLVHRAIMLFCQHTGRAGDIKVTLTKNIPVQAGLGGGSGNAAAALVACNRLFNTGLSDSDLEELGEGLGSDVPFFIRGGTQLARGRGTELTKLMSIVQGRFLIIKPAISVSTPEVYDRLKLGLTTRSPKVNIRITEALIARFPTGSWFGTNRLEEVVLPDQPELQRLLRDLQDHASIALLAGSGSAIFGVFPDDHDMAGAMELLDGMDLFVHKADPFSRGVVFTDE